MSLITTKEREARLGICDQEIGLVELAEKLRIKSETRNVFLKIGEEGVLIHAETFSDSNWLTDRIPALNAIAVDVAGAEDSLLLASAMSLAGGATIREAAALGCIAAAIQVGRVGNIPLSSNELLQQLQD
jgi:bifunctional ADP-heptose synthase (sugar kinase/adenylyltransferase)